MAAKYICVVWQRVMMMTMTCLDKVPSNKHPYCLQQHIEGQAECPFCLCAPCIVDPSNMQGWWIREPRLPHSRNSGLRKKKYYNFWANLQNRGAWRDARYLDRKALALGRDPRRKYYTWAGRASRREMMPDCVIKTVRTWLPNKPGVAYMGHKWEWINTQAPVVGLYIAKTKLMDTKFDQRYIDTHYTYM